VNHAWRPLQGGGSGGGVRAGIPRPGAAQPAQGAIGTRDGGAGVGGAGRGDATDDRRYAVDQRFAADDVRRMHRLWLGGIYVWASEYRQVNMGKGDFMFAAAGQVPRLMRELERGALREFTPCRFADAEGQARALATVHAELILIHPFRDGNGRCARLLATLMGLQAGLPALDFGGIRGETKRRYIGEVHAALDRDYRPMTAIFRGVIARSLRTQVTASSARGRS